MVTRRDLRAERDFYSPITGGTEIRYSKAPEKRDTYGSAVKTRMAGMQNVKSTRTNPIEAALVEILKTEDPFTQVKEKKSYAPEEDSDFMGALGGLGSTDEVKEAVQDFVEPIVSSGSGQRSSQRRADQQFARQESNPSPKTSTAELVARDNRRYGNTVPAGSFGSGSLATIKASPTSVVDTNIARHSVGRPEDQPGYEAPKKNLPTTYGGAIGVADSLRKIKEKQESKTVTIDGQTVAKKQSVASLPSNYKSTEAAAFAKAKAFKGQQAAAKAAAEGKNKAQQAAAARKATGTSISAAKAANQASMRAAAAARHASYKAQRAAGTHARTASAQRARNKAAAKARAKAAAKRRKSKKSCPDPSMLILMANGLQKKAGDLMVGDLIKTNHEKDMKLGEYKVEYVNVVNDIPKTKLIFEESEIVCSLTHKFYVGNDWKAAEDMVIGDEVSGQKLISIENVEDGDVVHITVEDAHTYICEGLLSHNKRCDIRTKDDISKLTDMNLLRDDLANVAYFVKELQETI